MRQTLEPIESKGSDQWEAVWRIIKEATLVAHSNKPAMSHVDVAGLAPVGRDVIERLWTVIESKKGGYRVSSRVLGVLGSPDDLSRIITLLNGVGESPGDYRKKRTQYPALDLSLAYYVARGGQDAQRALSALERCAHPQQQRVFLGQDAKGSLVASYAMGCVIALEVTRSQEAYEFLIEASKTSYEDSLGDIRLSNRFRAQALTSAYRLSDLIATSGDVWAALDRPRVSHSPSYEVQAMQALGFTAEDVLK